MSDIIIIYLYKCCICSEKPSLRYSIYNTYYMYYFGVYLICHYISTKKIPKLPISWFADSAIALHVLQQSGQERALSSHDKKLILILYPNHFILGCHLKSLTLSHFELILTTLILFGF